MIHETPSKLSRFKFHSGAPRRGGGAIKRDPNGDLIHLDDMRGLMAAAVELEAYGANIGRLEKLGRELRRIGL